ncbi:MAG: 30S ribosomal protein S7 [Pseudomonadota bacterium]|nr:30S ribosomal protein S7 [Pseudomonadota bacterium]MED5430021.1 30S ribosomal protein S7 [Pseudomonadota bacterium]|tara:strand:- start:42 stop:512 length:471 start_codon:yes stop_codon:yes gene_type:complete
MPRKRDIQNKIIKPDSLFNNIAVSKLTNMIMVDGKKSVAEKIVYQALEILSKKNDGDALSLMDKALQNVSPSVEVKSRRVGGSNYQVPVEVNPKRKQSLAMRWIIEAATKRSEKSMKDKLAYELIDASENKGSAVKKREDVHKMAEANKAFAHYRW